jgi:hypothetical protein
MRLVQFTHPSRGRRVGLVEAETLYDLTDIDPTWTHVYHIFRQAREQDRLVEVLISERLDRNRVRSLAYMDLWRARPGDAEGWLLPPFDHPDAAHCFVGGTGLTHLGSTAARDAMHKAASTSQPKTDSQKMFEMGLQGGKPPVGTRGIAPECFYKGSGAILRGHNDWLDIPSFTEDGGEEPEIVGCYIIGSDGVPYRLGFAVGNEWSDHTVERVNYLWLAPSKLRTCAIGPELVTDESFQDLRGSCHIYRGEGTLYDAGELLTGEENMSHSLANLEDHHFKHPQFCVPGDVHIYFFGTMKLSFGSRGPFQDGDRIEISFPRMGAPLVNIVRRLPPDSRPVSARKG